MSTDSKNFQTIAANINGVHTDISYYKFATNFCLFITQYEKINNVFLVTNENTQNGSIKHQSVNVVHKFGTDTDEIQSAIVYLVKKVPYLQNLSVDLVLNLGLKDINRTVLQSLENCLCKIFS